MRFLFVGVSVVTVTATSATGEEMVGDFQVFDIGAQLELPAASFGNTDGTSRVSVITVPPSDLKLEWDTSSISADSVEVVLVAVVQDTEELQDVAVLGGQSNTGSFLVLSTALDEFDLEGSYVFFKVRGLRWPSGVNLQAPKDTSSRERGFWLSNATFYFPLPGMKSAVLRLKTQHFHNHATGGMAGPSHVL